MTRYAGDQNLLSKSTDKDLDSLTISHLGLTNTPPLINWGAAPHADFTIATTGTIEISQDGSNIYDDHGSVANHPYAGYSSSPAVRVYFRVFDGKGYSPVDYWDFTLEALAAGDVIAPSFVSMTPVAGSTNVDETTAPILHFSEALQQGVAGKTLNLINDATSAIIETFTLPGAMGSGPGKVQITGADVTIQPTTSLPKGVKVNVNMDAGFVKDLSGNDCAAMTGNAVSFTTVPVVASLAYPDDPDNWRGRSSNISFDPTGAIIVDAAGSGSYTTITAAMAAAVAGNTIAVKQGVYEEAFTMKAGVTLQGWNTDKPIISAQQAVTGFTQCSAADASVLGTTLGVANSPIWKKTGILKSILSITDLLGLAPMENWVPLFNAQDTADANNPDFQEDESRFYDIAADGGSYTMSGIYIVGVTDNTVIKASKYTNAQLLAAKVRYFGKPNEIYISQITSADVSTGTIGFANTSKEVDGSGRKRFALQNIAPAMVTGTYFYVDNGTTFDLYVYPYNPLNINKITVAARKTIITIPNSGSDITIRGFQFMSPSGTAGPEGAAITKVSNGTKFSNLAIEHNLFVGSTNTAQLHYGAIKLIACDNVLVQHNSFKWCGAHGFYPDGSTKDDNVSTIRRNVFYRCGSAGAKAYRQWKYAYMHNYAIWCGYRAHGNLGNVYAGGVDAVWWGNDFLRCNGYLTSQNMSNASYCFNNIPCEDKYYANPSMRSNRKIDNQGVSGFCYVLNNSAFPVFTGLANWGHMAIYAGDPGLTIYIMNNIAHGISAPGDTQGTVALCKNNLVTHDGPSGNLPGQPSVAGNLDPSDFLGGPGLFDTTNVFNTNLAAIYMDYAARDWRPANASSPIKTMSAYDIQSIVNSYFIPTFTGATAYNVPVGDFGLDVKGKAINWAALKIGADQSV